MGRREIKREDGSVVVMENGRIVTNLPAAVEPNVPVSAGHGPAVAAQTRQPLNPDAAMALAKRPTGPAPLESDSDGYGYVAESAQYVTPEGDLLVEIVPDPDPDFSDPRADDGNIGVMATRHSRYNKLGDRQDLDPGDYDGPEEMLEDLKREHGTRVMLPLYLLDHSGLSMRTSSFNDPWDSGQVGVIYDTAKARSEAGLENATDEEIADYLRSEVKVYDQYLRGDVYVAVVTRRDLEGNVTSDTFGLGVGNADELLRDVASEYVDDPDSARVDF